MVRISPSSKAARAVKTVASTARTRVKRSGPVAKTVAGLALGTAAVAATTLAAKKVMDAVGNGSEPEVTPQHRKRRKRSPVYRK